MQSRSFRTFATMKSQHCRGLLVFRENSMITQWEDTSVTWNTFGNGVQPDGTEAEMMTSFTIPQPVDDTLLEIDVTSDVAAWIGGAPNQGWVFIINSGDGWDFDSAETTTNPPKLTVVYLVGDETLAPTAAPTNAPPTASPTSDSFFYGSVTPKLDLATGLPLLALPDGFEYFSFGWTGHIMDDGRPTPPGHDGMGVAAKKGNVIALVRNHELSPGVRLDSKMLGSRQAKYIHLGLHILFYCSLLSRPAILHSSRVELTIWTLRLVATQIFFGTFEKGKW